MKVEGGGVATSTGAPASVILHRIKVKEEAKDCGTTTSTTSTTATALQTSNVSPPPAAARSLAIGAIATITISSGCNELATAPTSAAVQADVEPVDLDLKSGARAKAISRDKIPPREDANGTESRGSSSPSPSSSPGSHYNHHHQHHHHHHHHQQQKLQSRAASSSSPDSDDCPPLQTLKTEAQDEVRNPDDSKSEINGNASSSTAATGRCIPGIFAAHGKLKRLLGTLVQFAMDISPDTGDTVRTLVLGLLSGSMTAEEFHSALQEATNFPLRGFVLPYLKHTLPSLQRDLSSAARSDNQSCGQYLRANESAVLEAVGLVSSSSVSSASAGGTAEDPFGTEHVLGGHAQTQHYVAMRPSPMHPVAAAPPHLAFGIAAKRRASDALYYENGALFDDGPPYPKRSSNPWSHHPHPQHAQHPHHHPPQQPAASHHHLPHHQQQQQQQHPAGTDSSYNCWYPHPLSSHAHGPGAIPGYGSLAAAGHLSSSHQPSAIAPHASANPGAAASQNGSTSGSSLDDEWKNIHVMLNCILGMVEKTKRALAILQKRGCTSPAAVLSANGAPQSVNNNSAQQQQQQSQESSGHDRDGNFKRLSGEIVAQTIRATEDRVAEVKRRAEEAVQEVKRVAMAEVQRAVAVAVAESRASERRRYLDNLPLSQQSRAHHGRPAPFLPTPARPTGAGTTDDLDKESHPGSTCWNCGRPALETCGGCGVARYCGSFCQHRDWEAGGHHATCATTTSSTTNTIAQPDRSSTPSPPTAGDNNIADPTAKSVSRTAK